MARLQILELPEGASGDRAAFVLVVDQCAPQRIVLGMGQAPMRDYWQEIADRIGARAVIVTAETVEVPVPLLPFFEAVETRGEFGDDPAWRARQLEGKLKEFAEAQHRELVDRMDEITDALGIDRLRDWGEIVWAAKSVRAAAEEGGHRFGGPGANDPVVCSVCRLDKGAWYRGDTRTCEVVRIDKAAGHDFHGIGPGGQLRCLRCDTDRIAWAANREAPPCEVMRPAEGEG
ncbi:hypothetical protein AB0D78_28215 [Streptomyces avermitilis]|uniref:hypothetical protein n=1 Tax=Streptomyces avermitilis TaxID=33903 RepID=UPI00340A23C6